MLIGMHGRPRCGHVDLRIRVVRDPRSEARLGGGTEKKKEAKMRNGMGRRVRCRDGARESVHCRSVVGVNVASHVA